MDDGFYEQKIANILDNYQKDNASVADYYKWQLITKIVDTDNAQILENLFVICDSYTKRFQ